ncbi:hypothetical protein GGX14DRAFT_565840 [Mycena pura]|uniref:DUF6534 domain-containing protein n=1 Tax=Mycena pura TaxID=153505 RepID=A0AAD6VHU0_9AGAR|nr:hypothetical protein GGX14DRAFT_565840 [Mycena pura]
MAPVVIPGVDLPLLTGPLVLGYMWSWFLYGILVVQVYMYSQVFTRDSNGIKALVWSMFFLESVFTLLQTIAAWNAYGVGWGDVDTLTNIDWSWDPLPTMNGFLAAMAQSFYIWRIYRLTKKPWIPALIACVMLTQMTLASYYGIVVSVTERTVAKLISLSPEVTAWLVGSATCDLLITITLVSILWRQRQETRFQRTTGIINKLIRFSVETGSVTSAAAIIEVILWLTSRQWNFHFIFFLVIGKLYSNMLMATLNCRAPMFQSENSTMVGQPTSSFWSEPGNKNATSGLRSRGGGVHVARTTNTDNGGDTIVMGDFTSSGNIDVGRKLAHDDAEDKANMSLVV